MGPSQSVTGQWTFFHVGVDDAALFYKRKQTDDRFSKVYERIVVTVNKTTLVQWGADESRGDINPEDSGSVIIMQNSACDILYFNFVCVEPEKRIGETSGKVRDNRIISWDRTQD